MQILELRGKTQEAALRGLPSLEHRHGGAKSLHPLNFPARPGQAAVGVAHRQQRGIGRATTGTQEIHQLELRHVADHVRLGQEMRCPILRGSHERVDGQM